MYINSGFFLKSGLFSLIFLVGFTAANAQILPGKNIFNEIPSDSAYRKNIQTDNRIAFVVYNNITQTPSSIRFRENNSYKLSQTDNILQKLLPVKKGIDQLKRSARTKPSGNIEVTRYQQYFKGIKVEQGAYTVTARNGNISFINGEYYVLHSAKSTTPVINEPTALQHALSYIGAQKYMWQDRSSTNTRFGKFPKGELVIMSDYYGKEGLALAYKFDVYATVPLSRNEIYVSAVTGRVIYKDPLIHHANSPGSSDTKYSGTKNITTDQHAGTYRLRETRGAAAGIETYDMNNATDYSAATDFIDADNNWSAAEYDNANQDIAAIDAHWGAETVYDYWLNTHNRKSFNDLDSVIRSYVHYDLSYNNAFFNGDVMTYGDGAYPTPGGFKILTSLDVCGHEIGHGICQNTAHLFYNRESGAINEGFSDIWASCIEHFADPAGATYDYWLIGEQVTPTYIRGVNRDALRDMKNPKAQGQPDTYMGQHWIDASVGGCPVPDANTNDNCGVHYNSGVLNKWFYLVTMGGSGTNDLNNNYQLNGLGFNRSEKIAYLTELNLAPGADYTNCRTASINAAATLYGACSEEVEIVTNAWYAVGIGGTYTPCRPTVQFNNVADSISETASSHTICPPSKTVTLGVTLSSAASAKTDVTLIVGGSAVAGRDYDIFSPAVSFAAGQFGTKNISITIYDDAIIEGSRALEIGFTMDANGGDAIKASSFNGYNLTITDDDAAPAAAISDTIQYGNYAADLISNGILNASYRDKKIQHLYSAADLKSYGISAGTIKRIGFYVSVQASPANIYKNFNVGAGFTSNTSMNNSFISGLTSQYSNSNFSPVAGWNDFNLSSPLVWDGVSSLVIQFCYNNSSNASNDDALAGEEKSSGTKVTAYSRVSSGSSNGCSLSSSITTSQYRPILRILETIPGVEAETTLTSSLEEKLGPNQDVYFYSPGGKIMARINNLTSFDYGCTQVTIDRTGSSSKIFWNNFTDNYLCSKSFKVVPTNNTTAGNYQVSLFYDSTEAKGWETATGNSWVNAKMVKVSNGHYVPDVSPATQYVSSITLVNGSADTIGSNYILTGNFTNAGFSGFGVGVPGVAAIPLPVTITGFTGYDENGHALLEWKTAAEYNNKGFELERSYDGINFTKIAFINGYGNSQESHQYSYNERSLLTNIQYYRLKQIDLDRKGTYTNTVLLRSNRKGKMDILSVTNPFNNKISILFTEPPAGNISVELLDITGKYVYRNNKPGGNAGLADISVNADISSGMYILKITAGSQQFVRKLVKQ